MADPVIIEIPEGAWKLVAENVTNGSIHRLKTDVKYYQTYRPTGEAAPTNPSTPREVTEEAVRLFGSGNQVSISSSDAIDVYLLTVSDPGGRTGKVRVDI